MSVALWCALHTVRKTGTLDRIEFRADLLSRLPVPTGVAPVPNKFRCLVLVSRLSGFVDRRRLRCANEQVRKDRHEGKNALVVLNNCAGTLCDPRTAISVARLHYGLFYGFLVGPLTAIPLFVLEPLLHALLSSRRQKHDESVQER